MGCHFMQGHADGMEEIAGVDKAPSQLLIGTLTHQRNGVGTPRESSHPRRRLHRGPLPNPRCRSFLGRKRGASIFQLGGGSQATGVPPTYAKDSLAIRSLHTEKWNIVVVLSGGNLGPKPSTISNLVPWMITIGASSIDRSFPSPIVLGNHHAVIEGMRVANGLEVKRAGAVPSSTATLLPTGTRSAWTPTSFPGLWWQVTAPMPSSSSTSAETRILPPCSSPAKTVHDVKPAPVMAAFSSQGRCNPIALMGECADQKLTGRFINLHDLLHPIDMTLHEVAPHHSHRTVMELPHGGLPKGLYSLE
ncbi:hypothetical protein Taro_009895 [Colocasia esculenta]|uniref:Uncharacterized protein n=1 Tax=Colocasia esculenta TaxID=4460 RepID=A0A843UBA8_COLES|nr:hypothetical protein [Colocasia esculenta]